MTTSFATIRARAEARKGGAQALAARLPEQPDRAALGRLADDRVLAAMTKAVFRAGFNWAVIDAKWPGFEAAFHGFDIGRLLFEPDDFWGHLASDTRIVRNGQKIMSVRDNAVFIADCAGRHGSFGNMLAEWDVADQIGLMDLMARKGGRLGGNTGQMVLRMLGWDGFVLSGDVVACLIDAGCDIQPEAKSKRNLKLIQAMFNQWQRETGLPYLHLSRIAAFSIGENRGEDYPSDA